MKKEKLIEEIDKVIDEDWFVDDREFEFDEDIKIVVEPYKTKDRDGYTITFQSIRIGDYYIKANHYNGEKLVETAEKLRASIDTIGLEKTIETLTHEQDWTDKTIRELN